ncbi:MAG: FAD-dependent monooxygenase [Gammaproteobacteria bacterium]|nr:FAD-dependent monooxygenase [Gammaproteobacteria bacterium]
MEKCINFDAILCGGGHVGSCLALALAQQNCKVAFIDSLAPTERKNNQNDNRIFALAAGSRKILESLQVWPLLQAHTTPIEHIHVSNKGSFGAARLHAKDFNHDALGYMTSSIALQHALNQTMEKVDITIFSPASLEKFSIYDDYVDVTLSGGKKLTGQWLIGADGVNSFVRQHAGINVTVKDYQQKALITLIDLENSHHFTAYERFVGESAIALLPHTPWQSVLIWSAENHFIDHLMSLADKPFLNELQNAFGFRLGKFSSLSPRLSYPLKQTKADSIHAERILLVGSAAQTLHPIGAQGFNLALRNVELLSYLIKKARSRHETAFTQSMLDEYAQRQAVDTSKTLRFTDHLVNFSSLSDPLSSVARTILINALGSSSLAQKYLLQF